MTFPTAGFNGQMPVPALITPGEVSKIADPRISAPFYKKATVRFPTTREIETAIMQVQHLNQPFPLRDRFFPDASTFATEIDMYLTRVDNATEVGMTFVHQYETDVRTVDFTQHADIAKASWSPISFKESKVWGEREMLELGRLSDNVAQSTAIGQIAEFLVRLRNRMENRKRWMCAQVLLTGKLMINQNDQDNPNRLRYNINYGMTDFELGMPIKFDSRGGDTKSVLDPIDWAIKYNRALQFFPGRKLVEMIVNSSFIEYLADNDFMREYVDLERGATTLEKFGPMRPFYRERVLEIFKRLTGLQVTVIDDVYEDETGQAKYWIPNGEATLIFGNTGPLGHFVHTAHLHAGSGDGNVRIGTGEFMWTNDMSKTSKPRYEIIAGFNGMPRIEGYDTRDYGFYRVKHLTYAAAPLGAGLIAPLPKALDITGPII